MDGGRKADLEEIQQSLKKTKNRNEQKELSLIRSSILNENKNITRLRERLINATRRGRGFDVAELSEQIKDLEKRKGLSRGW